MTDLQPALAPDEEARVSQRRENTAKAEALMATLDPGIAPYVAILINAGVETYESCQGGEGHAYPEPSVRFDGSQGAGWWALQVCLDHALPVKSLSRIWTMNDREPHGPYWQLVFRNPALEKLRQMREER